MISPVSPINKPNQDASPTGTALPILSIVICSGFLLSFLYSVFANYWPGPFVDYWIDIPNVEKSFNGTLTLNNLISAHANVHRLFIPRLLFIADYHFFAGTNTLLITVSLLCKLATLWLFNQLIKNESIKTRLMLNMLIFAAILNAANISNVLHNSNIQWDLVSVFSCFAIYFYSRYSSNTTALQTAALILALFFFTCGFLSQAGALPVTWVFLFISLLNKRWKEAIAAFLFMLLVFYLTFAVLPVNEPQNPTYEPAVVTVILKIKYVAIYVFKMFSGSIYPLDHTIFSFSWILLALFILSLSLSHKTKAVYDNIFLHIALFAFLMMVTIAAARVNFAPKTWAANRYQTNVMLFTLALGLHSYFSAPVWFGNQYKTWFQNTILVLCMGSLLITQYLLSNYGVIFSNKVFAAQAYMLTHGVNQYNGADLLPSIHDEYDRIAVSDPFLRQHGFAWYANKQARYSDAHKETRKIGETLLNPQEAIDFPNTCTNQSTSVTYAKVEDGEGLQFSAILQNNHLRSILPRNTYYVLDAGGTVLGFSYWFIDPDHQYRHGEMRGYVTSANAKYAAEIHRDGKAICLYSLDQANEAIH